MNDEGEAGLYTSSKLITETAPVSNSAPSPVSTVLQETAIVGEGGTDGMILGI